MSMKFWPGTYISKSSSSKYKHPLDVLSDITISQVQCNKTYVVNLLSN